MSAESQEKEVQRGGENMTREIGGANVARGLKRALRSIMGLVGMCSGFECDMSSFKVARGGQVFSSLLL